MPTGFFAAFIVFFGAAMAYLLRDAMLEKKGGTKQWNEKMLATRQTAQAPDSWKFGEWKQHEGYDKADIEAVGYVLAVSDKLFKGNCFHFVFASSPRRAGEDVYFTGGEDYYAASLKNIKGRYVRQFHVVTLDEEADREFLNSPECQILRRAAKTGEPIRIKAMTAKSLTCQPDPRFHAVAFDDSMTCPFIHALEVEWV